MTSARVGILAGLAAWAAASTVGATFAHAQAQKGVISDKTVLTLMDFAWALTPGEYTTETGKVVKINKDKFDEVKLPVDDAREVIRVARLSGQAQLCEMPEAQTANYETLMEREVARAKWTDQQLVFINKLHLFTVITLTGQVKAVESDKATMPKEAPGKPDVNCTEADRKRIEEQVLAYVKTAPTAPADPKKK
jgi:hypothetical protein